MKDRSIAAAIVLLALSILFVGGTRVASPPATDQYLVNDGKIFRFPVAAQGRIDVLEKDAQGKYQWATGG